MVRPAVGLAGLVCRRAGGMPPLPFEDGDDDDGDPAPLRGFALARWAELARSLLPSLLVTQFLLSGVDTSSLLSPMQPLRFSSALPSWLPQDMTRRNTPGEEEADLDLGLAGVIITLSSLPIGLAADSLAGKSRVVAAVSAREAAVSAASALAVVAMALALAAARVSLVSICAGEQITRVLSAATLS